MTDQPPFINLHPGRPDQAFIPPKLKNKEIKTSLTFGDYSLNIEAKSPKKPRIDIIFLENSDNASVTCVYFPISKLEVRKKGSQYSIDLVKLIPKNWGFNLVTSRSDTDEDYNLNAPEQLAALMNLNRIVPPSEKNGEILIGPIHKIELDPNLVLSINEKTYVQELLWNVLLAKAVAQFGLPADQQTTEFIRQKVTDRRDKLIEELDKLSSTELFSIASSDY